jgi:membrane-bound lytic murein transglycosylase B
MIRLARTTLLLVLVVATRVPEAGAQPYPERSDVQTFIAEMAERNGFDPATLRHQFGKARPSPAVLKAIAPPADPGVRSWRAYRGRFVEPRRVAGGRAFWQHHATALTRAEAIYGVPAEIIVAIIGVETFYGQHTGNFHAFNALTNLAFDYPPRTDLFRGELEALLLLAREEQRDPWTYRSSYAGAIGLPQFLPSSQRRYAVDFDRDGRIDLSGRSVDAIGSVGHFLAEHGWLTGEEIARTVRVDGDPAALVAEGIRPVRLPAEMARFGVETEGAPARPAALIDLATPDGPTEYRLGFHNFFVLTRYNRSSFYAAAVMDLAERLKATRSGTPAD